jgi:hypothetical protein
VDKVCPLVLHGALVLERFGTSGHSVYACCQLHVCRYAPPAHAMSHVHTHAHTPTRPHAHTHTHTHTTTTTTLLTSSTTVFPPTLAPLGVYQYHDSCGRPRLVNSTESSPEASFQRDTAVSPEVARLQALLWVSSLLFSSLFHSDGMILHVFENGALAVRYHHHSGFDHLTVRLAFASSRR